MLSSYSVVTLLCAVTLILRPHYTHSVDLKESCSTCRQITDTFVKGFERTAKKNFGGGNTAWEERKLGKYETSEIRLLEIVESLCDSSSFECNHMVEEHEEHFETWWFRRRAKHPDIFKWFCINTIKACCPNGTFGLDCNACVGGSERPCHGNGACDGDGTRAGHGGCSCNHGYQGEFCLDCADGYFNKERNDTFSLCAACDRVCSGCTGAGPDRCLTCADGYRDEDGTCADIDDCMLKEQVCSGEHRECVNTEGSYTCQCSSGFQEQDGVCVQTPGPGDHTAG
ncbi:cysteine-rich with EGF-like domain protein 2 [Megalops cyprinoides]|uniref:cysteine-rich with EGF-like domain protein 2 n=1 Tax=Megalops cyprinoides TaxID=118141 RepID=UPI001864A031|nr:cysteine-rich with EGF-like domain protein 2 [Megalops cyprinoides]